MTLTNILSFLQKFQKNYFFGHCSFIQLVHDVEKLKRKPKIFVMVDKDFGMYNMWAKYFKKSTRSSQSCKFGKILQCWKNLGMFPSSRF